MAIFDDGAPCLASGDGCYRGPSAAGAGSGQEPAPFAGQIVCRNGTLLGRHHPADPPLEDVADLSGYEHPVICRIVCNSAKPMRQNENLYVVQATKDWSKDHLEDTADWVGKHMLQSFCSLTSTACNCNVAVCASLALRFH